jgi:16S rRNA (adenine(1408)-N(1))-methyltransferase
VVIDVGAGDGRYPYTMARQDPAGLYIGVDPDADAMSEYAFRASRKPARGGADNVLFVVAGLTQLPPELAGLATIVRVNFPWAGLLRGILTADAASAAALGSLMAPGGALEVVVSYDPQHDRGATDGEALPPLSEAYIRETLAPAYGKAGFEFQEVRRLPLDEALAIPSTWGRRLLHGRPRDVFFIRAHRSGDAAVLRAPTD